ncbi:hypothetical protein [Sphingobium sp. CFD-2]|uniref:hypothetical protein n=1 Tax=Sphingobium sp. CFD-2 TaxID=2878542 RepID=UPI00214C0897|nr:hypothetical protein [Sphingobium sp. CFD-2]
MTDKAYGFDGLMSYSTDVDAAIAEADRLAAKAPPPAPSRPAPVVQPDAPVHRDSGAISGGVKKVGGWVLGIGLLLAVKACIFGGVNAIRHSDTSDSSSPETVAEAPYVASDTADTSGESGEGSNATTSEWSADDAPTAESDDGSVLTKPDAGVATLSIAELRYCIAEDIRIGAEKTEMDSAHILNVDRFNRHVDDFNANVDDFNSRCSHRSFMSSDKSVADGQVEAQRAAFESEGRSRVD